MENKLSTEYLKVKTSKKWWLILSTIYLILGVSILSVILFVIFSALEYISADEIMFVFSTICLSLALFLGSYSCFSAAKSIKEKDFNLERYLVLNHKYLRNTGIILLLLLIDLGFFAIMDI